MQDPCRPISCLAAPQLRRKRPATAAKSEQSRPYNNCQGASVMNNRSRRANARETMKINQQAFALTHAVKNALCNPRVQTTGLLLVAGGLVFATPADAAPHVVH